MGHYGWQLELAQIPLHTPIMESIGLDWEQVFLQHKVMEFLGMEQCGWQLVKVQISLHTPIMESLGQVLEQVFLKDMAEVSHITHDDRTPLPSPPHKWLRLDMEAIPLRIPRMASHGTLDQVHFHRAMEWHGMEPCGLQ